MEDPSGKIQYFIYQILSSKDSEECLSMCKDLIIFIKDGDFFDHVDVVLDSFKLSAQNKKSGIERESSMIFIIAMCKELKEAAFPFVVAFIPLILDLFSDKGQVVRDAAQLALDEIINIASPLSYRRILLPQLFIGMQSSAKWQGKVACLKILSEFIRKAPTFMTMALPWLIPHVCECMRETKPEVTAVANDTLKALGTIVNNRDIEPILPVIFSCLARPSEIPACIEKVSCTTFVSEVTGPLLALLVPLLDRALQDRSSTVTRQTVIIINNLCKLVKNPKDAGKYLPKLYPNLNQLCENAAFPEIRALAISARETFLKAGGGVENIGLDELSLEEASFVNTADIELISSVTNSQISKFKPKFVHNNSIYYSSILCSELADLPNFQKSDWELCIATFIDIYIGKENSLTVAQEVRKHFLERHEKMNQAAEIYQNADSTFPGEEICSCDFSLAYGGRMLLNHTKLILYRGQRYGLCGANGAGKSTLMRAIANGKVEGFPTADKLSTVFVEHALQGVETDLKLVDFVLSHERLKHVTREEAEKVLRSFGFTDALMDCSLDQLSGGWKMKVELARAMLMNADILLLDEPTNHLDTTNVKWLEDYLNSLTNVTSIIVSHDSGFLDNVCTCIIHYQEKKLVYYKGNLSKFVERHPPAQSYYTLEAVQKFSFPTPGLLVGVKSNTKAILKMSNVYFSYPNTDKKHIKNVTVQISLSSRVGILGKNGAGKSTMIKLMTGEVFPTEGAIWKHPNLRIGYVAQHAFHHLEMHLDSTPAQYLRWRYEGGQDREVLEKETRKLTDEDKQLLSKPITVNGEMRFMEYISGRQKLKKSFTYEIKWKNKEHRHNTWIPRDVLLENGFFKFVQAFDDHEASREGLSYRDLNPKAIRDHFQEVGLDPEIAEYSKIAQLSGGQKVKVVIGAAMWNNPHLLVLDEPTNFLDRESLGGFAAAIKEWGGAVVMISHNAEFITSLCPELWTMVDGDLTVKGGRSNADEENVDSNEKTDEASPKPRKKKKMTRNELKAQQVRRRQRHLKWLNEGGEKEADTDSD